MEYLLLSNTKGRMAGTWNNWMNLKCTVLNERSQTQKGIYCLISLTWHPEKTKNMNSNQLAVARHRRSGERIARKRAGGKSGGCWRRSKSRLWCSNRTVHVCQFIELYTQKGEMECVFKLQLNKSDFKKVKQKLKSRASEKTKREVVSGMNQRTLTIS